MKFTELSPFNGCYNLRFGDVARSPTRSSEAVLLLHGFPAEQGNKNIDVAEMLASEFQIDVYLLHYRGLGQSEGEFSFKSAIDDSVAYAKKIIKENGYDRLHLVGHSFGGWVATEVYNQLQADHRGLLILLAPFTHVDEGEGAMQLALNFMRHYPHVLPSNQFETVTAELTELRDKMHPQRTAKKLSDHADDVLIVHAMGDEIIPRAMNQKLKEAWGQNVTYVDLDTDHRFFRNRERLVNQVRDFFKRKLKKEN